LVTGRLKPKGIRVKQQFNRTLVVVMDGVGLRSSRFGNAVAAAKTPNLDRLLASNLSTTLKAHGTAVGLPSDDDIGNSEVGHNALGAGRIFAQGAKLVNQAVQDGSLFQGSAWKEVVAAAAGHTLHFLGLLSDGNVHSNQEHLHAMLRRAKADGVRRVRIHALLDGRDVGEKTAEVYVERLEKVIGELSSPGFDIAVASGGGRMHITMDRYNADWPMVKRGWDTHVLGKGRRFASIGDAIAEFRKDPKITDQNFPAFVVEQNGHPAGTVSDGDAVVFFNFRGDRAIEISRAFTESDFREFDRERFPQVTYAGMMQYDGDLKIPARYLVSPPAISGTLSEVLAKAGARQFACSETQKFGHVTYFWNGNRSGYFNKATEEYVEVHSDPADLFESKPQMKAREISDVTIDRMEKGTFDFGRINYANGDMVGHTGSMEAATRAVEAVDHELGRLMAVADRTGTTLLITADHGNADQMYDGKESDFPDWETKGFTKKPTPKTAHTLAPVPFVIYGARAGQLAMAGVENRTLGNVANTVMTVMGLPQHPEYLPGLVKEVAK
jgi:2,3-bisphosphoglycerate-independent phosphoglycerate mutase